MSSVQTRRFENDLPSVAHPEAFRTFQAEATTHATLCLVDSLGLSQALVDLGERGPSLRTRQMGAFHSRPLGGTLGSQSEFSQVRRDIHRRPSQGEPLKVADNGICTTMSSSDGIHDAGWTCDVVSPGKHAPLMGRHRVRVNDEEIPVGKPEPVF
jgi:hypothetical protein